MAWHGCNKPVPGHRSFERAAVAGRLVAANAPAPVYVVNGVEVPAATAKAIDASRISSVEIVKSVTKEPSRIVITTQDAKLSPEAMGALKLTKQADAGTTVGSIVRTGSVRSTNPAGPLMFTDKGHLIGEEHAKAWESFTGLILIDGVVSTMAAMNSLSPADIASVEVVKGGGAARESSDPAAANGIIKIATKRRAAP